MEQLKIGMCTGPSRLDDSAFIYSAWSGLRKAQENLDVKITIIETQREENTLKHLSYFNEKGYDLIWAIGYDMDEPLKEAVQTLPDQKLASIDVSLDTIPPNLLSISYREYEGAFLAGYAAARTTQTGQVGFLGGRQAPLIEKFQAGYLAGAKHANPEVTIKVKWANTFISYERGQVIGEELYNDGCDVVFHAAGAVGKGLIRKAMEMDKLAIGVDMDQSFLAPNHVMTSMLKKVKETIFLMTKDFKEGTFQGGANVEMGLKENMIDLTPITISRAPEGLQEELNAVKEKIIAGQIDVPSTMGELSS